MRTITNVTADQPPDAWHRHDAVVPWRPA